jgi:mono/diheme cytochrome c family protein
MYPRNDGQCGLHSTVIFGHAWIIQMSGFRVIPAILFSLFAPSLFGAPLVWTPETNHVRSVHLLTNLITEFHYTNTTSEPVVVTSVERSCHCTTPKTPPLPWTIPPHVSGKMEVIVEVPGKWGLLQKTIEIRSASETNVLLLEVEIPEPEPREKNRIAAFVDRQAVFKSDCATCHRTPAIGLKGAQLYEKACGICHDAEHRATMVPDLATKPHGDTKYWTQWIRIGKPGTFMPGFDEPHGGPLSEEQIASLLEYLPSRFPPTADAKAKLPLE